LARSINNKTKGNGVLKMDTPGLRMDEDHFMDEPDTPGPITGQTMPLFRISLGFAELNDPALDDFASNVAAKLTANASLFTGLPVTVAALTAAQSAFHISLSTAKGAGKVATADKNTKRATLQGLLRQDALFIQGIPNLTVDNARLSGYQVIVSGPRAAVEVNTPAIVKVTNVASGKLGLKVQAPYGYKSLEVRGAVGGNPSVLLGVFPSTRGIVVEPLQPGTLYLLQLRALFGSNRFSEWSEPVQHMCT
jgi:hypothetical protein